jgi:hypothetical protein
MPVAALRVGNLFIAGVLAARIIYTSEESASVLLADMFDPSAAALFTSV